MGSVAMTNQYSLCKSGLSLNYGLRKTVNYDFRKFIQILRPTHFTPDFTRITPEIPNRNCKESYFLVLQLN